MNRGAEGIGVRLLNGPARRWGPAVVLVGLTVAVGAPGAPLEQRLGVDSAEAAPTVTQRIFNQDRTIRPQRFVGTKVFCPGRLIPFTWGYRPISPPQAGVNVNAILTSVVPDQRGTKKAGFTITLFNPNPGATVQMRVSTTCIEAKAGLRTALGRGGSAAGKPKPTLTLDTEKSKLNIPAGQRVSKKVFCDRKKDSAVADAGYKSGQSELVGFLPAKKKGVPGAQIVVQNRTAVDDKGKAFVNCVEGKRFKVSETTSDPLPRGADTAPADERRAGASAKRGLIFDRTSFPAEQPTGGERFTVRCGEAKAFPAVNAIAAGGFFSIGPTSGPALEQFVTERGSFVFRDEGSASVAGNGSTATVLDVLLFFLRNNEVEQARMERLSSCAKGTGGVKTLVHSKSAFEQ